MSQPALSAPPYDVARVRKNFPILQSSMRGHPLVYLDTASSAQKPSSVMDAIVELYSRHYANIHRGLYELSEISTRLYDDAREKVQRLLGAEKSREIVSTAQPHGHPQQHVEDRASKRQLAGPHRGAQEGEQGDEQAQLRQPNGQSDGPTQPAGGRQRIRNALTHLVPLLMLRVPTWQWPSAREQLDRGSMIPPYSPSLHPHVPSTGSFLDPGGGH